MKWFKKHKKILLPGITVLLLLLAVLISFQTMPGGSGIGGMLKTGTSAVQEPLTKGENGIRGFFGSLFRFQEISRENQALKEEIASLKKENTKNALSGQELEELRSLAAALDYKDPSGQGQMVAADVISMDGSNWFNLFTINRGSESGIENDAIVVTGEGLVGRVLETGQGWSKVIGIIDESNKVSFKVLRDPALLGVLHGDGLAGLSGYMLDGKASIIEGDLLVTTSIGMYPEGIEIGVIKEIQFDNDTQLKNVTIEPVVNFKNIQKVAVIL
jgi:rod shape-determining protein MreC